MFRAPMPRLISAISPVTRMLPSTILSWLFWSWPSSQITVLRSLLFSSSTVFAAISMGQDEMANICELDTPLLVKFKNRIWFYYAEKDDWVDDQRQVVLKALDADPGYVRVVHGGQDI